MVKPTNQITTMSLLKQNKKNVANQQRFFIFEYLLDNY